MSKKKTQSKFREAYPDSWEPKKEGDTIEGTIYGIRTVETKFGVVPVIDLVTLDGEERSVMMGGASLGKIFLTNQIEEEGFIGLEYRGLSNSIEQGGNKLKRFAAYYYRPFEWKLQETKEGIEAVPRSDKEIMEARKHTQDDQYKALMSSSNNNHQQSEPGEQLPF